MIEFVVLCLAAGFIGGYFAERFAWTKKMKDVLDKLMSKKS